MKAKAEPILYQWSDGVMKPLKRFHNLVSQFVEGGIYELTWKRGRSMRSHRHFFAGLRPAWENLPETIADDYPTKEIFRKQSLIDVGYFTVRSILCGDHEEALRVARVWQKEDVYDRYKVSGNILTRYTADSQRVDAMGDREFQECKQRLLDLWASLLGVTVAELLAMDRKSDHSTTADRSMGPALARGIA